MKADVVVEFDFLGQQEITVGLVQSETGATSDPGMLLLAAASFLGHNIVCIPSFSGSIQQVILKNIAAGGVNSQCDPAPASGVTWPPGLDGLARVDITNHDFSLSADPGVVAEPADVMVVTLNEGVSPDGITSLEVRRPGVQAMVAALACRDTSSTLFFDAATNEVLGVSGFFA